MYYCTCKSLWIEKASVGKLGVKPRFHLKRMNVVLHSHSRAKSELRFHY